MNAYVKLRLADVEKALLAFLIVSACFMGLGVYPAAAIPATLLSADQAAQVIAIRDLTVKEGVVSGELLNRSSRRLRDVQLLIRYTWLWNDEFHPGQDDLGVAIYYTVEGEIPPGGSKPFAYRPSPPLPSRADGHFETVVSVAGYTEIIPPK